MNINLNPPFPASFETIYKFISTFLIHKYICSLESPLNQS